MRNHVWNTAHPIKRLVAYIIDIIPIWLIGIIVSIQIFRVNPLAANDPLSGAAAFIAARKAKMIISLCTFGVWLLYCTLAEVSPWAGTFGKKLMGLKVRNLEGKRPGLFQALARNLAKIVSVAPFSLGLVWATISKTRRTWHELLTGTAVVER
ncbi:RDD family protein [Luteolibacter ambystomatis]|uniref:RDD family protein n=1 Tax=Luteolibacter ambystomatis TaxID=2824561 RepID=A0A975PFK1_9BACT|nr:RDD family protein [Luteolibacter ambystomatis]QUE52073.1 RDD family protein [Luteolibacter ambystomatis]